MEYNNLLELIKTISESNITSFKYEEGDMKIHMSTSDMVIDTYEINTLDNISSGNAAKANLLNQASLVKTDSSIIEQSATVSVQKETRKQPSDMSKQEEMASGNIILSPLVGTFYVAPSEDSEPFVKIGDTVKKGQTLAIVEAMKLMNEIESEYDGVITEVYVSNAEAVEFGQPLFKIS